MLVAVADFGMAEVVAGAGEDEGRVPFGFRVVEDEGGGAEEGGGFGVDF